MVCTVSITDCAIGDQLLALRRDLAFRNMPVSHQFHASEDKQAVRDEVFNLISSFDFRVDATLLDKPKAMPRIRETEDNFYKYAWFYHFKHVGPAVMQDFREISVTASAIGTKRGQASFKSAVNDVLQQVARNRVWRASFPPSASDPCLQVADYCAWAIQRKWERGDSRSYNLIKSKITTEYDLFSPGVIEYY